MTFLTAIIMIGLLLLLGNWLLQRWEARQQAPTAQAPATAQELTETSTSRLSTYMNAVRTQLTAIQANLLGAKQPNVATQFRLWLAGTLGTEPALHHWLMALSDEQLNALATHIERFTREMGFELSWLLNQEVAQQPALTHALTTVVLDYCRACHHAVALQEDLGVYKALREYNQNPSNSQNREFGQALFGKLLEQGLTSIKVADHLALPEAQRHQQIIETINRVATEKPALLQHIVKELFVPKSTSAVNGPAPTATMNGTVTQAKA